MRLAILLALVLALVLSGCGSDDGSSGRNQSPSGKPATTTTQKGGGYNYP